MPQGKRWRFLIVAGVLLIAAGLLLVTWILDTEDERNTIEIRLSGNRTSTEEIVFDNLALVPGEVCEYDVILKGDRTLKGDTYKLSMDFVEIKEGRLKDYARIKILSNDIIVHDELLATVLEGEDIEFSIDFNGERSKSLKILFYLPAEVGNEAKKAEALFKLVLTACNE